jgi:hypothetical protein
MPTLAVAVPANGHSATTGPDAVHPMPRAREDSFAALRLSKFVGLSTATRGHYVWVQYAVLPSALAARRVVVWMRRYAWGVHSAVQMQMHLRVGSVVQMVRTTLVVFVATLMKSIVNSHAAWEHAGLRDV